MVSVAIVSNAKLFIRALIVPPNLRLLNQLIGPSPPGSPAVQQVVGGIMHVCNLSNNLTLSQPGIYTGTIIYAATSYFDILPDHYKRKKITLYNPRAAPILDHYRLKVPRVRQALETI